MLVKSMKIFFMSIIFMLNCFATLYGTTYYVSPSGSDNNPGTLDQPWKTIGKANLALQAGDTVYIRQGTYHETIEPVRSGSEGKYITYASYPGEMATITDVTDGIRLYNKEYIRVIRLKIDYVSFWINAGYGSNAGVNHSEFAHLICTNGTKGPNYGGMYFRNSSYNWIHHCYISTCGTHVPDRGDAVAFRYDSFYNLFENNTLRYAGHELMNLHGSYNVIRKNDFQNLWDKCINVQDMTGEKGFREERGYRNLIGDNIFAYAQPSDAPTNPGMQFTANDCIIRRNRIFKNIGHGISAGALTYAPRCENNRIYHNTIYGNGGWAFIMTQYSTGISIDNNVLKNNILFYNNPTNTEVIRWVTSVNSFENNKIIANNILNKQPGENSIYLSGNGAKPVAWWQQNYPDNFSGNIQVDPQFVDADNNNYELLPSSGCIDVGAFLSVITNSGSGTQIKVQDASYFCDGFGIIEGDLIQIEGQTQTARIIRVDYNNNTITIDRTLTWYIGQGVALPYNGSAPDIGAFEYGGFSPLTAIATASPTSGPIPLTVNFTGNATGGTPPYSYSWNFGNNSSSNEQNPIHTYNEARGYTASLSVTDIEGNQDNKSVNINGFVDTTPYLMRNTFEQDDEGWGGAIGSTDYERDNSTSYAGSYSMHVYATGAESKLSIGVNPVAWNVDQYPFLSVAYKIPSNVPVGIFFNTDASWICLGGAKNYNSGGYPVNDAYSLADDDSWHVIILNVRDKIREVYSSANTILEFEWYTQNNGQQGDEFWFDEVVILADNNAQPKALISLSDRSPTKAGLVEVILTTSKNVTNLPTPLIFTESDHSVTSIDLQGSIPGTTFTGSFDVNDSIAEGVGYFSLNPDALVDEQGNTGNEIVSGIYVKIDKTPPAKPKNLTARNISP